MGLKRDIPVLVVGAGPVGLFAALSLAERGIGVEIVDKEWRGSVHSYALALHPQSLRLLDEHGAADDLMAQGHRIERVAFYVGDDRVAALDLSALDGAFPFILVAPQSAIENALEKRLKKHKIKVLWNHEAQSIQQGKEGVTAKVARMEKFSTGYPIAHTEWMTTKETDVQASFLVGADGYHSSVRKILGSRFEQVGDAQTFAVFEFPARVEFQHEARIVFHDGSTNVVWPLDDRRGRWSFQVADAPRPGLTLESLQGFVRERAPWFPASIEEIHWNTTGVFERRLADRFGKERIWLAGDAAHITGPVGAQSMNVGLREAHDLAERISGVLKGGGALETLEHYQAERRAEWRRLLGVEGGVEPLAESPAWAGEQADRILPCMPASGRDLETLLGQLGLRLY